MAALEGKLFQRDEQGRPLRTDDGRLIHAAAGDYDVEVTLAEWYSWTPEQVAALPQDYIWNLYARKTAGQQLQERETKKQRRRGKQDDDYGE